MIINESEDDFYLKFIGGCEPYYLDVIYKNPNKDFYDICIEKYKFFAIGIPIILRHMEKPHIKGRKTNLVNKFIKCLNESVE